MARGLREIHIYFAGHSIQQHEKVEYLGYQLDSNLSGEAMASKVLKNINATLKFMYRQRRYLTPAYKRLLCNTLIQLHFDYECSSWFPVLKKNFKELKLQKAQNKCIRFCLNFPPRSHVDPSHFRKSGERQGRILYCNYRF